MRSIWRLYQSARSQDNDDSGITGLTNSLTTLNTTVNSRNGYNVGSVAPRVINVASAPTTIPDAGTVNFDTTRKCALFSDGTSMFLATGSLA